jgi:uncharacterized protein (TIGR02246 family)
MKRSILLLILATVATGRGLNAQEAAKIAIPRPDARPAPAAAPAREDDERAIKALLDAFIKAFDAGDADAAAATYTETAIVVEDRGEKVEGRAAIRGLYAGSFADNPGSKIAIRSDLLRFLGAETAIEQGRTTITPPAGRGAPEISRYTAIYIKHDGRWLQSVVRDEAAHDVTPHERLKELEWLVGDWVNESQDAVVSTTCKWAPGGNFLVRDFTMKTKGRPVLSGSQRIGWDPLSHRFKTWIFDSEGGHGEGHWTRTGDQWVIKLEGVNQDGKPVSATNIVTRLGKDRMGWQSTDRTLGGAAIPGIDEFIVVRTPPDAAK